MKAIKTEGPVGVEFTSWCDDAEEAREKMIRMRRVSGKTPKPNADVLRELKVKFLFDLFSGTCAYCESKIPRHNSPGSVDHYRPIREVTEGRDKIDHTGYFWLAYEWDNLLPVCQNCNTSHSDYTGGGRRRHPGKKNEFPIKGVRVVAPSGNPSTWKEDLRREIPLLLNPYHDTPEEHINFSDLGVPYPKNGSERGKATIDICDLGREALCEKRREFAKQIFTKRFHRMLEVAGTKALEPNDPFHSWLEHAIPMHLERLVNKGGIKVEAVSMDSE